jgi:hypothetical protein
VFVVRELPIIVFNIVIVRGYALNEFLVDHVPFSAAQDKRFLLWSNSAQRHL